MVKSNRSDKMASNNNSNKISSFFKSFKLENRERLCWVEHFKKFPDEAT